MLALMIGTHLWSIRAARRSRATTFCFSRAVAIQVAMLAFKLETLEEAKVILRLPRRRHVMEMFKTVVGSWIYPEPAFFRIGGVPLFSGFMYASHRQLHRRAAGGCSISASRAIRRCGRSSLLGVAIYVNFFAHHYIPDMRCLLFAAAALLFGRSLDLLQGLAQ